MTNKTFNLRGGFVLRLKAHKRTYTGPNGKYSWKLFNSKHRVVAHGYADSIYEAKEMAKESK